MSVTDAEPIVEPVGESLPPPAAPPPYVLEPGDLVASWRIAIVATWALVVFVYSASGRRASSSASAPGGSARGPIRSRRSCGLIPFAVAIGFGLVSSFHFKRLPAITLLGAVVLALIAVPDFSRSVGLATLELITAGAVLLVGLGSLTGVVKTADR